ncbi:MAG: diguanylate cyclase [Myxococcota bacterium]
MGHDEALPPASHQPEVDATSATTWMHFPDRVYRVTPEGLASPLNGEPPRRPVRLDVLVPARDQAEAVSLCSRARRSRRPQTLHLRADDGPDLEARFVPEGEGDGVLLFLRDLSDLTEGEDALRDQLRESQALLRRAPVGIFRTDALGGCVFVNERWKELTQIGAAQALGDGWAEPIHPDDRAHLFRLWEASAEEGREVTAEIRFQTAQDGARHMLTSAAPIFREGELTGYLGVLVDITERVEAERQAEATQTMMRRVTDTTPLIIFITDIETERVVYVNREFERVLGYPPEEMTQGGDAFWRALHHEAYDGVPGTVRHRVRALHDGEVVTRNAMMRHASGQWRWLRKHTTVFTRDDDGQVAQVLTTAEDITAQREAEERVSAAHADAKQKAQELQRKNHSVEVLHEMSELLQSCNDREEALAAIVTAMKQLFDRAGAIHLFDTEAGTLPVAVRWGEEDPSDDVIRPEDCWALRRGRPHGARRGPSRLRCRHLHHDRSYMCAPLSAAGERLGLLYVEVDEADDHAESLARTVADGVALGLCNLQLRTTLREQAVREPLTGLYNRRHMEATLDRELHQADRRGSEVSVVMLDVDHFKRFNDTHGHEAGDVCLRKLAHHLGASTRRGDIACRFGGEEFALILPDCPLDGALARAEAFCAEIRKLPLMYRGRDIGPVTVSMGVAVWPAHGEDGDALVRSADLALYRAKRRGRNQVAVAVAPGDLDPVDAQTTSLSPVEIEPANDRDQATG